MMPQQITHRETARELGAAVAAATAPVEGGSGGIDQGLDHRGGVDLHWRAAVRQQAADPQAQPLGQAVQFAVIPVIPGTQFLKQGQVPAARAPVPVPRRKVGPAEERLAVGSQPDRHRPTSPAGHRLHRRHVDRVDVRPFLPVHLDRNVVLVEEPCDLKVLERFTLHDVAPVAGAVADAEENRPPEASGGFKRLIPPGIPVHRVVGMLQQVRAGGQGQPVGEPGRSVIMEKLGSRHIIRTEPFHRRSQLRLQRR